jgi:anti-sigma factor RsiW
MKSRDAQELFSAYLEGELSAEEAEALRSHFARCPDDAVEYRAFETAVELTRGLPREEPGVDFTDIVMARARQARHVVPVPAGRSWLRSGAPLARVAALAAVLSVGFVSGLALLRVLDVGVEGGPAVGAHMVAGSATEDVASPEMTDANPDIVATDSVSAPQIWDQFQNAPLRQVRSGDENATVVF